MTIANDVMEMTPLRIPALFFHAFPLFQAASFVSINLFHTTNLSSYLTINPIHQSPSLLQPHRRSRVLLSKKLSERMGSQEEEEEIPTPPSWKNMAMKELAQGRNSVAKLASLLQLDSLENSWPEKATASLLIEEIINRINKSMATMESGEKLEVNQVGYPSSCATSNNEGIRGKRKMQSTRKAGYRRRGSPYSWTRITSSTIDDGHTWRKYGQKDIFSAKYPRSYFRCTHKFDQGCKASKQVQRSEDDPSLFVITYFGEHTCVEVRKAIIPPSRQLCIISFESSNGENIKQETLSSFPSLNQESEEEVLSNLTSADSASDYFVSPEAEFQKSAHEQTAAGLSQEHNGLSSTLYSSLMSYGMELMDYDDLLNFDHIDLFQD